METKTKTKTFIFFRRLNMEERTLQQFICILNRFNGLMRNILRLNQLCGALTAEQMQSVVHMYNHVMDPENTTRTSDMRVWYMELKQRVATMPKDAPKKAHCEMMLEILQQYTVNFCMFFAELGEVIQDPQTLPDVAKSAKVLHDTVKIYWKLLEILYEASAKYSPPLLTDGEICKIFFLYKPNEMQQMVRDSMGRLDTLLQGRLIDARDHHKRMRDITWLIREIDETIVPCRRELVEKAKECMQEFITETKIDPKSVPVMDL